MTIATIDIGTNTVLLLVVDIDDRGAITSLSYEQRVPRLGTGVDRDKMLSAESIDRVMGVLREYREMIARYRVDAVAVCGTSAVREAGNRDDFARRVKQEAGFELEILSGDDEALWTYRGALSGLPDVEHATVIDIGGGSTEITLGDRTSIREKISLDVGSVRLTERMFHHDPPTHFELESAIEMVENEIGLAARFHFAGSTLIGVAGTATTLAVLAQGLRVFDVKAVTNYTLKQERVEELFRMLRSLPSSTIRELSTVMEGRHDVITAGSLILREVMAHFKFGGMIVSERGVRYGLAIREWERRSLDCSQSLLSD
jgi:exopolyphosphatase/guanosine-5'-triphosphate,3'-diphosphate pyrophosphatase